MSIACAEEVKGIEFTVTTLNCAQDQGNHAPEQRHRFSSMRKTGALSKVVRSKISKSFYHTTSSNNKNEKLSHTNSCTENEKLKESESIGKIKSTSNASKSNTQLTTTTTATTVIAGGKNKKRSKLCQLL